MNSEFQSYIISRLMQMPVVLFLVSIIIFFIVHVPSAGPIEVMLGPFATPETVEALREQYHLNEPLHIQYWLWLKGIFTGSLGVSITTGKPVAAMIIPRLPVTILLGLLSIAIAVSIALFAGYISAIEHYTWKDHLATFLAFLGLSIPNFFLAILLILVVGVNMNLLPISAGDQLFKDPIATVLVFIMPAVSLGTAIAAQLTRMLRSSMLEIFNQEYVQVARAKGLSRKFVNRYIVFKNALIPVITLIALQLGFVLGGTVIIEQVFALPGIGRLLLQSVLDRDFPVIQALVLIYAVVFILSNLVADILYGYIDPRISYGGEQL